MRPTEELQQLNAAIPSLYHGTRVLACLPGLAPH